MHTLTHRKNNKERRKQVNEQTFLCFQKIFISFPSMMSKKHTKGKPSKPSSSFLPTKELCHPNKVSLANQGITHATLNKENVKLHNPHAWS